MDTFSLLAISPVDGRYASKTRDLQQYFSEFALFKYRVLVEIEYFIALCELPLPQLKNVSADKLNKLRDIYKNFSVEDARAIKEIEKITNHDVKAVEYFIKQKFEPLGLDSVKEFVHFGLTSQDINNTAVPLALKDFLHTVFFPAVETTIQNIKAKAAEWKDIPLLARTHGQPASPTKLGKEFDVFVERLSNQFNMLKEIPVASKFGGATGNFNAHHVAFPGIDWPKFANEFVNTILGLHRYQKTTQIEHYDYLSALLDNVKRINTILFDLNRDIWTYISMDYFKQKIKPGEVGSSAMPHKVNPIDFENSEGNIGIANALFTHLSAKLPVSRLQRDLTDSTVIRNLGVPFAHSVLALSSFNKGLEKLIVNEEKIKADLEDNWAVVAEALQTILRREQYPEPYETLKALTRTNQKITPEIICNFIDTLNVSNEIKEEMKKITPFNYTGVF